MPRALRLGDINGGGTWADILPQNKVWALGSYED
jgi:hypothetical protein